MLRLDSTRVDPFLEDVERGAVAPMVEAAHSQVLDATGEGSEMLGWRELALRPDEAVLARVAGVASEIRDRADVLVCVGIGGSYLGAEAVIQALSPHLQRAAGTEVLFAGHHISASYHRELLAHLESRSVYVNVISKSGSTLEPALAFRLLRRFVEEHFDDSDRRIIVTTGPSGGLLNPLADDRGYRRFAIPDAVGGRFSVLTPVGLLPIAVAGLDVHRFVEGAGDAMKALEAPSGNPALEYARDRFILHRSGFTTEVMAIMEPRLAAFAAWWQQLFGESEGKQGKALFPTVARYTTDLHSIGQYVQEGPRNLIETFLLIDGEGESLTIGEEPGDPDGLNYLAGKSYADVNDAAYAGTAAAHSEGGVPNFTLALPALDEASLGGAVAFFQHAVAVGGYLLGVNPFDQPGVEAYKRKMFELLGR